jgi:hypothetical protein
MRLGSRRERLYDVASGADLICASAPSWHSIDVLGRSDTSNEMPDDVEALKQRLQVSEAERDLLKLMVDVGAERNLSQRADPILSQG